MDRFGWHEDQQGYCQIWSSKGHLIRK